MPDVLEGTANMCYSHVRRSILAISILSLCSLNTYSQSTACEPVNGAAANGQDSTACGANATANGNGSTAIGANTLVNGSDSVAIGNGATTQGGGSVALGAGSIATDGNASVGSPGDERRIQNVAPGIEHTDAVNVSQLEDAIDGANDFTVEQINVLAADVDVAIQEGDQNTLNQANQFTATQVNTLNQTINEGDQNAINISIGYTSDQINNTVNTLRNEFQQGDRNTLIQANQYTDQRVSVLREENDRHLSMAAAMMNAAAAVGGADDCGRFAIGTGFAGGEAAISVMYGRPVNDRVRANLGAVYGNGGQVAGGFGIGFDF